MKVNWDKLLLGILLIAGFQAQSQKKNIEVEKIYSDENSSTFNILIRDSVRLHYHQSHTENIFVIQGSAEMQLNDSLFQISVGDHFIIPEGSHHAV